MAYEAQIAGVQDAPAGPAAPRRSPSAGCRRSRRASWPSGGPPSSPRSRRSPRWSSSTAAAPAASSAPAPRRPVTEVAAGSGLYAPALFDGYRAFTARPAAFFAVPVTRRARPGSSPSPAAAGSPPGRPGADRLPVPTYPAGLRWLPAEGAGEVQTPLRGPGTARPARRRPGVVPARQGRGALRARRRPAHAGRRRPHRRRSHLPRRGPRLRLTAPRRHRRMVAPGARADASPCRRSTAVDVSGRAATRVSSNTGSADS